MLGLVVNPVAGIGGHAGLGGSDGIEVQRRAAERGGVARAGERARDALEVVARVHPHARVLTASGAMGEDAVTASGLIAEVVYSCSGVTTAKDTSAAARALVAHGADLVLFAGGDGTARDVAAGIGTETAALGIPAGVKMYSPVFATSARGAGAVAAAWLDADLPVRELEVLDVDEDALRSGRVESVLHAQLRVPFVQGRTQARKSASPASEHAAARAAACGALESFRPGVRYFLGPGGTMSELARLLGAEGSPLGVDIVLDGEIVVHSASETELLAHAATGPAKAVVTVIGGQGFLLGRGNQQLSSRVLESLGSDPLIVVAPEQKLIDLGGRPLLVDTGSHALDAALAGFIRVITGVSTSAIYPVHAPQNEGSSHAS